MVLCGSEHWNKKHFFCVLPYSAGPESLEDYFQKGVLIGKKAGLNLWYVDVRPNSQKPRAFEGLSYLTRNLMFNSIFYSHYSIRPFQQ